jgi:hypothetical protein
MLDTDALDKKTLREKWEVLTEHPTCPHPLRSFVGSRLLDEQHPEDDPRTTVLLVELTPGVAHSAVAHLTDALASFLDLSREAVYIERNAARARRVEITIVSPVEEA